MTAPLYPSEVNIHGNRLQLTSDSRLKVDGRYVPSVDTGGSVFYVSSVTGSSSNSGLSPDYPLATIEQALAKCTAGAMDQIIVSATHAETLGSAGTISFDVAGVSVIGLGCGFYCPKITYSATDATITVDADGVLLSGLRFNAATSGVSYGLQVSDGVDATRLLGNIFDTTTTGTDEFSRAIRVINNNVGTIIQDNLVDMGLGGAIAGIMLDADTDKTVIEGNRVIGDYSTANINGDTTLSTNLLIRKNLLSNGIGGDLGSEPCIELLTGTTGWIEYNSIYCNLATKSASIVADTMLLHENYYNEDISGAATSGIIGAASADD